MSEEKQLTGFEHLVKTFPSLKNIDVGSVPKDVYAMLSATPSTHVGWTEGQRRKVQEWVMHELVEAGLCRK